MNIIHVLILSVLEGLTEFLPISSTGHLIVASELLKLKNSVFLTSFMISIQLGAVLSVFLIYIRKFSNMKTLSQVFVSFLPSALVGFLGYGFIKTYLLHNSMIVIISLVLGGIFLIFFEKTRFINNSGKISMLSFKRSILVGVFQILSLIPGVSRSGATIVGGMFCGLSRKDAVTYSFLLSVPTMFAATGFDLLKSYRVFTFNELPLIGAGMLGSFLSAALAVKFLTRFVRKHSFLMFGYYRIIAGIIFYIILYL